MWDERGSRIRLPAAATHLRACRTSAPLSSWPLYKHGCLADGSAFRMVWFIRDAFTNPRPE